MKRRLLFHLFILSLFVCVLLAGSILYFTMKDYALKTAHKDAQRITDMVAENISGGITEHQRVVRLLAANESILRAIRNPDSQSLKRANRVLEFFRKTFDANVCYLMDRRGITLASSNWNSPKSFVNKNYSFRPYFKEAIGGQPSLYMALGVTSNKRGIYYSYPVAGNEEQTPLGVVVIKDTVQELEKAVSQGKQAI